MFPDLKVVQSIPKYIMTYASALSIGFSVGLYKGCESGYNNGYREAVHQITEIQKDDQENTSQPQHTLEQLLKQ